ncbi:MAG: type II toxin-antitoxin system HipA family toxin [Candidatus Eremiobacteraeota bacterium]|nr:type II toxin-antitoxin system HipA family toxin [Candidatus Eremiobacteraeota bacterium]
MDRRGVLSARFRFGPGADIAIGELALDGNVAVFEYDATFVTSDLPLSPMMPPGRPGLTRPRNPAAFTGLHGVFADSLPDAWGELLLERRLRAANRTLADFTVLDRLSDVGESGRGAIVYVPAIDHRDGEHDVDLDELALGAQKVYEGAASEVMCELELLGGSSGGARPKVQVWMDDAGHARSAPLATQPGYSAWIVKFASSVDRFKDIGPLEAAYADVARAAGVVMPRTRLIATAKGPGYFATERFDRDPNGARVHMLSIAGMLDTDWRYPSIDYDNLLDAIRGATRDQRAVEQGFRRMVFNVPSLNRDDHAKQHSLLFTQHHGWRLSPAYDLTYSTGPGAEHYLAVNGKGRDITRTDLLAVADRQDIDAKRAASIIDEVDTAIATLPATAKAYGVSGATAAEVRLAIETQRQIAGTSHSRLRRDRTGSVYKLE